MNSEPRTIFATPVIGPIVGVVDGSDAAPGEVGEFLVATGSFAYAAGTAAGVTSTGTIALLNVPPGDWDFTVSANFSTLIGSALYNLLPIPTGMSNGMDAALGDFSAAAALIRVVLIGQSARGSFAVATQLTFNVQVFQETAALPAGTMNMRLEARRRR